MIAASADGSEGAGAARQRTCSGRLLSKTGFPSSNLRKTGRAFSRKKPYMDEPAWHHESRLSRISVAAMHFVLTSGRVSRAWKPGDFSTVIRVVKLGQVGLEGVCHVGLARKA